MHQKELEPDTDIIENDEEYRIQAAVPGSPPHKIRVEATMHSVTLVAETLNPHNTDKTADRSGSTRVHRRSRHADHNLFRLVVNLHYAIEPQSVRAVFRHGVVEIRLPKVGTPPDSATEIGRASCRERV